MYILTGLSLLVSSIIGLFSKKIAKFLFLLLFVFLAIYLCLRYGQGTDYFSYEYLFNRIGTIQQELVSFAHGEIGWRITESVVKQLGMTFQQYVFLLSLVMSISTYVVIKKHSKNEVFSLFLLFPTFFMTYYVSAIREGFVISLFISIGYELLKKHKYIWYYIVIILLSLVHSSALVLLILPSILNMEKSKKAILVSIIVSVGVAVLAVLFGEIIVARIDSSISSYSDQSFSPLAFILRILMAAIIIILYRSKTNHTEDDNIMFKIYITGLVIYLVTSINPILSQRITVYFKIMEVFLIPNLVYRENKNYWKFKKNTLLCVMAVCAIFSVECVKNANTAIKEGGYKDGVTIFNYPFTTVINPEEIYSYRINKYK